MESPWGYVVSGFIHTAVIGIVIILPIVAVMYVLGKIARLRHNLPSQLRARTTVIEVEDVETIEGYRLRHTLLNNSEAAFFNLLKDSLPINYSVFPKMRVADIIETLGGHGYINRRNKILPTHVDFVVCNAQFKPLVAIEIDGHSHYKPDVVDRDNFKDQLFNSLEVPLIRIKVGSDFNDQIKSIIDTLKN